MNRFYPALALAGVAILTVGIATPAIAADNPPDTTPGFAAAAVAAIDNTDPALLAGAVSVAATETPASTQPALEATTAGSSITLPFDPAQSVTFAADDQSAIMAVALPFAEQASTATSAAAGSVVYDNNNGSATVPVVRADGGVQINTVISDPSAPTTYAYEFVLPAGAVVTSAGKTVLFTDGEKLLGGLAPAWAKDATGRDVPTRYEVHGTTVTQVIEHDQSYTYPVVADPWIGINLFSQITVDSYNAQPRVNLDLSSWGWAVYSGAAQGGGLAGIAAGQAILNTAGWDEAWGRGGVIRSALDKPSQRQQFSCHALGAIAAGTWNLEKFRPNRVNGDWGVGVAVHHCNWTTADRY